ncbi:MAG: carboxypeptidase regulatory-like domain-containing protein, partial [Rhodothermales bacterium]
MLLSTSIRRAAVAAAFIFLQYGAAAQTGAVEGRVTGDSGAGLPGASILLEDPAGWRSGTASNAEGNYRLEGISPGSYRLRVSHLGFRTFESAVVIEVGETLRVDVRLRPATLVQDEVLITATRARPQLTPITFSNLTARELEEQPAMKDLPVLLSTLPSTTYYSENGNGIGYSTLRMRGFDQRRVAVSINGIPQNDPEDFNVFWINFFDIQGAVEDIQVQRGAGSSFYGPTAIGG